MKLISVSSYDLYASWKTKNCSYRILMAPLSLMVVILFLVSMGQLFLSAKIELQRKNRKWCLRSGKLFDIIKYHAANETHLMVQFSNRSLHSCRIRCFLGRSAIWWDKVPSKINYQLATGHWLFSKRSLPHNFYSIYKAFNPSIHLNKF